VQAVQLLERLQQYAHTPFLLFANGGDHLGPQRELERLLAYFNRVIPGVCFSASTFPAYVRLVSARSDELPCWSGELRGARYNHLLAGVLSTRLPLKQANARTQTDLERWAEPFGAIAHVDGGPDPRPFLRVAWRLLLLNHAHDSICGCSIDQVHVEMQPRFDQARQIAAGVTQDALGYLLGRVRTRDFRAGPLAIVFNPTGGERSDVVIGSVHLPSSLLGKPLEVVSASGDRAPCQVLEADPAEEATVALAARSVPSVGYQTLAIEAASQPGSQVRLPGMSYDVHIADDGRLRLTHLPTGYVVDGAHLFVDEADAGDEYTCAPLPNRLTSACCTARSWLLHSGPVLTTYAIEQYWQLPERLTGDRRARSAVSVQMRMYTEVDLAVDARWITLRVTIDNAASDHRLRVVCPTGIAASAVEALGHFDRRTRPVTPPVHADWFETSGSANHQQGFVAVFGERVGVALLSPELPEYVAEPGETGVDLSLTLLRCVGWLSRDDLPTRPTAAGPQLSTPGAQCLGRATFSYAIAVVDRRDWPLIPAWAEEFRAPLQLVETRCQDGPLPPRLALVDVSGQAVLTAVKPAENGDGLVVRLYNSQPTAGAALVRPWRPPRYAWCCRLDESHIDALVVGVAGGVRIELKGSEIASMHLVFDR
jgi:mannosylglycerate hydrolase